MQLFDFDDLKPRIRKSNSHPILVTVNVMLDNWVITKFW
jgi:hypothetical protein